MKFPDIFSIKINVLVLISYSSFSNFVLLLLSKILSSFISFLLRYEYILEVSNEASFVLTTSWASSNIIVGDSIIFPKSSSLKWYLFSLGFPIQYIIASFSSDFKTEYKLNWIQWIFNL